MNFITPEFVLALPVVLLLYRLLPRRGRSWLLLAVSALAYLYWNGWSFLLLLAVVGVSYGGALLIRRARTPRSKRAWSAIAVLLVLGQLFLFKYLDFTVHIFRPGAPALDLLLPVGISFYTFQALSYVLDVSAGRIEPERSFALYALFITYFPQLVAGPIERPEHLLPQLRECPTPAKKDVQEGLVTLLSGFVMKLAIADPLARFAQPVYASPGQAGGLAVLVGTACFALQIYCDFAGYSAIAIGTSRMLGIRLMENFRQPYRSRSIRDFWRRWHISLTGWLTDYVYKPLGGSRRGLARRCANVMLVFLVSGLWHGANWTFVLWGALHGLYMVMELLLEKRLPERAWWRRGVTLALVCLAWIFFRAEDVPDAFALLRSLFTAWGPEYLGADLSLMGLDIPAAVGVLLRIAALAALPRLPQKLETRRDWLCLFLLALTVTVGFIAAGRAGGENTFIYFRF